MAKLSSASLLLLSVILFIAACSIANAQTNDVCQTETTADFDWRTNDGGPCGDNWCAGSCSDPSTYYPIFDNFQAGTWQNCTYPLSSSGLSIQQEITTILPEGKVANPIFIAPTIYITCLTACNVTFSYIYGNAGYTSQLGYFRYNLGTGNVDNINSAAMPNNVQQYPVVWPRLSTQGGGCTWYGDQVTVGEFDTQDVIGFFIYSNGYNDGETSSDQFFSFQTPTLSNPDGFNHTSWVYLSDFNLTVFGFEDLYGLGDQDYNDVMFTFTVSGQYSVSNIPTYGGGVIQTCTPLSSVAAASYLEVNCTQYGLLDSTSAQVCQSYFSPPTGWTVALDTPAMVSLIMQYGNSQWAYTGSGTCFILATSTGWTGYYADGTVCPSDLLVVKTYTTPGSSECFNAPCGARIVLQGQSLGSSCTASGGSCNPSSAGSVVAQDPSAGSGLQAPVLPFSLTAYIKASTGSLGVSSVVAIPANTYVLVDVMILIDLSGTSSSQQSSITSSAANLFANMAAAGFLPNAQGQLGTTIGFAFYTATTQTTYNVVIPAGLVSDQTSLNNQLSSYPSNAYTQTTTYMPDAAADLMGNANINWRDGAFRLLYMVSNNKWADGGANLLNASLTYNVVPMFQCAVTSGYCSSSWKTLASSYANAFPLSTAFYGSSKYAFNSVFTHGPSNAFTMATTVVAVAYQGTGYNFLNGFTSGSYSTTSYEMINSGSGLGTTTTVGYTLQWPSSLAVDYSVSSYSTAVQIMGLSSTVYTIYFDHPPAVPAFTTSMSENTVATLTFSPSDADGNTLQWFLVTAPSSGSLTRISDGSSVTLANPSLPAGVFQVYYTPNQYFIGTDTFNFLVSDGCINVSSTATITVTFVNSPPVAQDFSITVLQTDTYTTTAGKLDFGSHISDPDNTYSHLGQTLTTYLFSNPNPSNLGSLFTYVTSAQGTALTPGYSIANSLGRFEPSGTNYGVTTFQYRAYDGTAYSNPANVTVTVTHVNHPPVLSIPVTSYSGNPVISSGGTAITATITDQDVGDSENLYITNMYGMSSGQSVGSVSTSPSGNTYTSTSPLNFKIYSTDLTQQTNQVYPCTGLEWILFGSLSDPAFILTFAAQDNSGAWSNSINVTFTIASDSPPYWTNIPENSSFVGPIQINQNSQLLDLQFYASDLYQNNWDNLTFSVGAFPSNGKLYLVDKSTGTQTLWNNAALTYTAGLTQNFAYVNNPTNESRIALSYTPNNLYYGTDSFSLLVQTPHGTYANSPATVNIDVVRSLTPPLSADVSITVYENVTGTFSIPAYSTNDASNAVYLTLLSYNVPGTVFLSDFSNTVWSSGSTPQTTSQSYNMALFTPLGVYTNATTPAGTFTYNVTEPYSQLSSGPYVATVYIIHTPFPPYSQDYTATVKKGTVLTVSLFAGDVDPIADPSNTISAEILSLGAGNQGQLYTDAALTTTVAVGTNLGTSRTMYYVCYDSFSYPATSPLATFTFRVSSQAGLPSASTYVGQIFVLAEGTPPTYNGALKTITNENTAVGMNLNVQIQTEWGSMTGNNSVTLKITSLPSLGTLSACADSGLCTLISSNQLPLTLTSTSGRVFYVPPNYDYGDLVTPYTSFNFSVIDNNPPSWWPSGTNLFSTETMQIFVVHVNQPPNIISSNFPTTASSGYGIIVNESSSTVLNWQAWDIDSLPQNLTTQISVTFYTSNGFSLFSCQYQSGVSYNTSDCTFDPSVPLATRTTLAQAGFATVSPYSTITTTCPNLLTQKAATIASDGARDLNCQANFKMLFQPTPLAYFVPYISIRFTAVDDYGATSTSITALILVYELNQPPTIWSPSDVTGGAGLNNLFIQDNNGNPISVNDVDSQNNKELLTINITQGSGVLSWPSQAPCVADSAAGYSCTDLIAGFNQWLTYLRFNVSSGSSATLTFTINDLGHSSSYKNTPALTATSTTVVNLVAAAKAPSGSSSTLAIAIGVAAAAGLLVLGALGFFLRRQLAPPSDDYFSAATTPLSASPQSPLYQAQNKESMSPLYKGKA